MSSDGSNEDGPPDGGDTSWLAQYYTARKSGATDDFDPLQLLSVQPSEKYGILEDIGTGGMKSVRRALDRNALRHVAMARLKEGSANSDPTRRFLREARITAALEHPNIVPIHEIGVDETGGAYFTMKLLGGETLHRILKKRQTGSGSYRKTFPSARLLEIFLNVCNAVAFAHSRGVIHLDLKPENIQVGSFGEVLVLDWGLAKVMNRPDGTPALDLPEELADVPEQGVVLGTPEFMAPEQATGDHAALDERADVYALGALLHSILEGPAQARPAISAGLLAVVAKAKALSPAARYVSVEALARDIRAYVEGFPTMAQEASLLTQFGLLINRHRAVAGLVAASFVLICTILTVSFVRIHHSELVAVDALRRIKTEQENRRKIGLVAAPRVLQQADDSIHVLEYDEALSILDYALTLDDGLSQAWQQKAALHLGRLEYDQAISALLNEAKRDPNAPKTFRATLGDVATRFASMKPDAKGLLSEAQMRGFALAIIHAERTPWSQRLLALAAFMQRQNRTVDAAHLAVVKAVLVELNPDKADFFFTYQIGEDGLKVAIHGNHISQILPLVGLPITSLDLSNTAVTDLNYLRDMPLVELDLSGTGVDEFLPLSKISTLEKLRLVGWAKGDYDRLRNLPQLKQLTISWRNHTQAERAFKSLDQKPALVLE